MSDIEGGNLKFTAVFDDADIERGFQKAKREIQEMSGVLTKGADSIQDYFDGISDSLSAQKTFVKQLENEYQTLNKEIAKIGEGSGKKALIQESADLKKELEGEKITLAILDEMNKKLNSGYSDLNKQLRFLQAEMIRMEQAGQGNTAEFRAIQAEAVRLSTSIKDVQSSVKKLGDGQSALKGVNEAFRGLIGAVSAGTGAVAMFSGENENLQRIMVRLQSAMAMAIGMQEVSMALDKNSAFQTVTLTKVKTLYTAAITRMSAAMGVSTAAARVMMGVLTGGLTLAIGAAIVAWDRYNAKQEEAKKKLQERFDLERDARSAMFEARMELERNIRSIQTFNGTKEQEKKKISELNEKYGETFGYFKTLEQWYDTLIAKGGAYVQSLYLQAKAQALLKKAIDEEIKLDELKNTPSDQFRPWLGEGGKLSKGIQDGIDWMIGGDKSNNGLDHYGQDPGKIAKQKLVAAGEAAVTAIKGEWESIQNELNSVLSGNNLGGFEEDKNSNKKLADPFIKDLEDKKKAYEQYAAWINSSDASIREDADEQFKGLLKNGTNWLEYLNKLRGQLQAKLAENPGDKNLAKQLTEVTNQITGTTPKDETVLGKFDKDVDKVISNIETDVKEKLATIKAMRDEMASSDPLATEKTKVLDAASTSLTAQLFKQERTEVENTLKKYQGFLAEKLQFDTEYAEERARIQSKIDAAASEKEKAAYEEMLENLNKKRDELSVTPDEKEYQELLKSYETFEQKRKSISEKYAKDIEKARKKGDSALVGRIEGKRDNEIGKAAMDELVNTDAYKNLFEDLDNKSRDQIKKYLKALQKESGDLLIDVDMSPEAKALLKKMLKDAEGAMHTNNPFAQLADAMDKLKSGGSLKDFMKDADAATDSIAGIFYTITDGLEEMGVVTDQSTKEILNAGMKAVQGLVDAVAGYFSGNTGQMVSGIVGLITGLVKVFQFKNNKINKDVEKQSIEVQKLSNAYNQLGQEIEKALGSDYYKKQVDGLNKLYLLRNAIQKELDLEESRRKKKQDPARIEELKNQIKETENQIDDVLATIQESVTQTTAVGLAGQLSDAIVGAFSKGEDAAKAWGEVTNSVIQNAVKNALKMELIETPLQGAINQLYKDMGFNENGTGSFDGLTDAEQQRFRDEVDRISKMYNQAIEATGDLFKDLESIDPTNPLSGAIRGISQESGNIIAGHMNATRIIMADSNEIWKQHLLATYEIRDNTKRIDANTKNMEGLLKSIDSKTQSVAGDLRASGLG